MSRKIVGLFALAVCLFAERATATILTFEGLGVANSDAVPSAYGDNVEPLCDEVGCCDSTGCYEEGNGFTPNLSVNIGLFNLTDKSYIRWADTGSIGADAPGRFTQPGFNAGATVRLEF